MAGITGVLTNSGPKTLTAGGSAVLLRLTAPANQRLLIKEIVISAEQDTVQAPTQESVMAILLWASTTGTDSAVSPMKYNQNDDETLQATGGETQTVAGTTVQTQFAEEFYPSLGDKFRWQAPREKDYLIVKGGQSFLLVLDQKYASPNRAFTGRIVYEE